MGSIFYVNPKLLGRNLITALSITYRHPTLNRHVIVELRLPVAGERGWQCDPQRPLADDLREMLADWSDPDGPGWLHDVDGRAANGPDRYHAVVVAAFDGGDEPSAAPVKCDCSCLPCICKPDDRPSTFTQDFLLDGLRRRQAQAKAGATPERQAAVVAQAALDEFWAYVARSYPEAKTGDLAPDADLPLRQAATAAVKVWVDGNVRTPDVKDAKHVPMFRYDHTGKDPRRNSAGMVPADPRPRDVRAAKAVAENHGAPIPRPDHGEVNFWLDVLMPALDRLDDIGGPDDGVYCDVHAYIAAECLRRLSTLQPNRAAIIGAERRYATFGEGVAVELAKDKPDLDAARRACKESSKRKAFVTIELEIAGGTVAAHRAVEAVLDDGVLQDAINDYGEDNNGVKVKAATIVKGEAS